MVNIFIFGNLKVFLLTGLILLLHPIVVLLFHQIIFVLKYKQNSMDVVQKKVKLHILLEKKVNSCIAYEISENSTIISYPTLESNLFGAVRI